MNNNYSNDFFDLLKKKNIEVPDEVKIKIQKKIDNILSYEPRIGIFGKTGVGKSSLCNAMFGQDVCEISNVEACTRNPQDVLINFGNKGLKLIDVPGVGESGERDREYAELYHRLLPELDVILWVLKADDRAFSSDETFYKQVVKPHMEQGKPFFIVLNQIDKIEPFREWDVENQRPGANQHANILEKSRIVSTFFDIPASHVIPISANEKFGLIDLTDAIIFALPKEKQISFSKVVPIENLSEKAIEQAEKGMLETILDYTSKFISVVKDMVSTIKDVFNIFKW